jgi:fucose 4-O-acetylase-like acetyltransferase
VRAGPSPRRRKGLVALDGAIALMVILLIVQMWLLTATLESYLRGHHSVVMPAAVVSGVLCLACVRLALFAIRLDKTAREAD